MPNRYHLAITKGWRRSLINFETSFSTIAQIFKGLNFLFLHIGIQNIENSFHYEQVNLFPHSKRRSGLQKTSLLLNLNTLSVLMSVWRHFPLSHLSSYYLMIRNTILYLYEQKRKINKHRPSLFKESNAQKKLNKLLETWKTCGRRANAHVRSKSM